MNKVILGMGSNIGDRRIYIEKAIEFLGKHVKKIKTAKFYETKPQYHEDQDYFLNTAISGYTELTPRELLTFIKQIEVKTGRRPTFRYGPREVDIDILFYNDLIYKDKELVIPHPLLHEREFVLLPLMDIEPDFNHPVMKKKIKDLFKKFLERVPPRIV